VNSRRLLVAALASSLSLPAWSQSPPVDVDFVGPDAVIHGSVLVQPNRTGSANSVVVDVKGSAPKADSNKRWVSTAWAAALSSSSASRQSILAHRFVLKADGEVDGASLLASASFLAQLRGEAIKPEVAITGSINPDGTVGPVVDLPQKLAAASAAKKAVLVVPAGQRSVVDARTNEPVDLVTAGEALGVRVVEVATLRDAYRELTGVTLPARSTTTAEQLKAPDDVAEALGIRVDMWRASAESGFSRVQPALNELSPELRETLSWVYAPILTAVKAATTFEDAGLLLAAERKWFEATVATAAAEDELAILAAAKDGKLEEAFAVLLPYLELESQANTMLEEVGTALATGGTAGGAINAVLAADSVIAGLALVGTGKDGLQVAVDTIKQLERGADAMNSERINAFVLVLVKTAPILARAEATLAAARMDLAFAEAVAGGGASVSLPKLTSLANAWAAAGAAGTSSFQSVAGLTDTASFAFMEPAWAAAAEGPALAARFGTKPTDVDHVLALAAATQAYLSSSTLQNKYTALGYSNGVVAQGAALTAQVTAAREQALSSAAEVAAVTPVPARLRVEFSRADQLLSGTDDDKVDALQAYWRTSFAADLLAELNTTFVVEPPPPVVTKTPAKGVVKKPLKPKKKLLLKPKPKPRVVPGKKPPKPPVKAAKPVKPVKPTR
jgi:hypothetical protein